MPLRASGWSSAIKQFDLAWLGHLKLLALRKSGGLGNGIAGKIARSLVNRQHNGYFTIAFNIVNMPNPSRVRFLRHLSAKATTRRPAAHVPAIRRLRSAGHVPAASRRTHSRRAGRHLAEGRRGATQQNRNHEHRARACHDWFSKDHSYRRASMGSSREAFHAG